VTQEAGAPGTESGSEFRQKFESTQAENAALRGALAEKLGVSADDLKGVPADQVVAKAAELQEQRRAQREQVLRESLEERGLSGDDLETALAALKGTGAPAPAPAAQPAPSPFASTGSLGGSPVGTPAPTFTRGVDRIRHALNNPTKK
jgi:hypothetical protein